MSHETWSSGGPEKSAPPAPETLSSGGEKSEDLETWSFGVLGTLNFAKVRHDPLGTLS